MRAIIAKPVNDMQRAFNELCLKGGGPGGGPARPKVLSLLKKSGKNLNELAYSEARQHLDAFHDANPWHVCFAISLSWGHLAKLHLDFTEAVVGVLGNWNEKDLDVAKSFHLERGPDPIENSLKGAHRLFEEVVLPKSLPDTLELLTKAQNKWLTPVLHPNTRPLYIGPWNAMAIFMVALFAQPKLAATHVTSPPALPLGGPILAGLRYLHQAKIISTPPATKDMDDNFSDYSVIYADNGLFGELCSQQPGWCLLDVHSGIYMLGTRDPQSNSWV